MLPQSRLKPHTYFNDINYKTAFSDGHMDWIEMTFVHFLQRYNNYKSPQLRQKMFQHPVKSDSFHPNVKSPLWKTEQPQVGSLNSDTEESSYKSSPRETKRTHKWHHKQNWRDYLVPQERNTQGGLWWWDTSLPITMADNNECEKMYQFGLVNHILYQSKIFLCKDTVHAGKATVTDLVTMLLNLMCNSVLNLGQSVCCS